MSEVLRTDEISTPAREQAPYTPLADVPSTEQPQYFCILTSAGSAHEAAAHAAGKPVRLRWIAVGDGNGKVPTPTASVSRLVHEVYRRQIDSLSRDEDDPNVAWIHMVIPADDGGFWIREFGVYAEPLDDGGQPVLFAYGNHAPYYKLKRILGQAITHELSIPMIMSSTAQVEIVMSDAGYASRRELLHLSGVVESLRHPRQAVWSITAAIAVNGVLQLPSGITYQPGKNLVDLSWDGLVCHPGRQFEEISETGRLESSKLKLLFAAPAGSEFRVLVRGYSLQPKLPEDEIATGLITRLNALERTVKDVEDGAAYILNPSNS